MFGLPPLPAHIIELIVFALLSAVGLGVGLRLLRVIRVAHLLRLGEKLVYGLGLGYGALGFSMLAMGVVGVIYFPVGLTVLTVLALLGVGPLLGERRNIQAALRAALAGLRYPPNLFLLGIILLSVGSALAKALVPVATQDDLMYHLALPRHYIEDHAVAFYPDSTYSLFPQLMEMLYTWGLLLGSDRLAVLFAVGAGLLGPLAAGLFARRYTGEPGEGIWRALPLLVVALFVTTPLIAYILRAASTDLAQASFDLLAAYAVALWWGSDVDNIRFKVQGSRFKGEGQSATGLPVLAGVCAGLAFSVKYYGFAVGLVLGVGLLVTFFRRRNRWALVGLVAYGLSAGAMVAPWLIRNVFAASNPVWPLAGGLLGGSYWSAEASPETLLGKAPGLGLGNLWAGLEYMWVAMTRPTLLLDRQWYEVGLGLLPLSLLALPFARWKAPWRWVALVAAFYWLLWAFFFSHTSARYLSTFFLLVALIGSYGLVSLAGRTPRLRTVISVGVALIIAFLGLQAAWSAAPYVPTVLALDRVAEDKYLSSYMEDYSMIKYIQSNTPPSAVIYLWDGQPRGYRMPRRYVYARLVPLYTGFGGEPQLWRARLAELGITHVLVHKRDALAPGQQPGVDPNQKAADEFARRYFGPTLFRVGDYALYALR